MIRLRDRLQSLNARRRALGMSYAVLADRSGVSPATVKRVVGDPDYDPSVSTLCAVAEALGVSLDLRARHDVDAMLDRQARRKAEQLAGVVQGPQARARMVKRTVSLLLAGSRRRLWAPP